MSEKAKIINSAAECTVRAFMKCAFSDDLTSLIISGEPSKEELHDAWMMIYTEYVDLSGIIQTQEFELMKSIFYLDCRVKKIQLLVHIQNESIEKIGVPCVAAFDRIKLYGHRLIWDPEHPDLKAFKTRLLNIQSLEKRYAIELDCKIRELMTLKKKQVDMEEPGIQKRKEFIRALNNLEKSGYRIDRDKTTVEDLALMIADINELAEREQVTTK